MKRWGEEEKVKRQMDEATLESLFFFFKQKTAYEVLSGLVGSDFRSDSVSVHNSRSTRAASHSRMRSPVVPAWPSMKILGPDMTGDLSRLAIGALKSRPPHTPVPKDRTAIIVWSPTPVSRAIESRNNAGNE